MTDSLRTLAAETAPAVAMRRSLRTIAAFEAVKGLAAFAAAIGVLDLMHRDVRHLAIALIGHFGLNPDDRYPSILLHYADLLPAADVRSLLLMAFAYIAVRLFEAYGLWNDRAWGEWLGAVSGGVYIPFEFAHLMHRTSVINAAVLAGNCCVVAYLVYRLWCRRQQPQSASE